MTRKWLALAVLCAGTARGAGPTYSAAGIVNASNFAPGPFAASSVVAIFGENLAYSTLALGVDDLLPCPNATPQQPAMCFRKQDLNGVRVYVQGQPVPVLYVSEKQINFLMSSVEPAGPVTLRVVNDGNTGPNVEVTLVDAAPALFPNPGPGGYVIATDASGRLLAADNPAHAWDTVVIYLTGLGRTAPNPAVGEIPKYMATMVARPSLKITLNGTAVDPERIKYAGVTPGAAGLYQINLELPNGTGNDPEIQVTAGNAPAQTGLKLPVR